MGAEVVVVAGPAGTGKTARALSQYQQVAAQAEPGYCLWIAPNWRAVEEVRRGLLGNRIGYFAPGIMTFDRFAEAVVEFSGQQARFIDRGHQRWLIWQLVEERRKAGKFRYFVQIAHTTGFIDLLCDWIQELKRLEIWPDQFRQACQAKGMTDKDQELLDLYQAYQELLTEQELYDAEGRFWLARTLLAGGALLPPVQRQNLELIVVDGFSDFTRTQHEILEYLARRAAQLLITLPLEKEPGREELFAKPRTTLEQLRRRHLGLQVEWLERPAQPSWPALAHIERFVFANPRHYQPLPQKAERIEILAAASQLAEVELLAKRIKHLLVEGEPDDRGPVRPDDILVLFRSLEPVADLVREVFSRYGIPFLLETSVPLRAARSLRALGELLQLAVEDWPFRRLLAVLNHSYFQPDWPQWQQGRAGLIAEQMIRRLQIPQGQEQLFQALQRLASSEGEHGSKAQTTLVLLKRLAEVLDALPERATLSGWARAWRQLASQVGILQAIQTQPLGSLDSAQPGPAEPPSQLNLEELAWQHLEGLLASADQLWGWLNRPAAELDRREALAVLSDLLARASLPFSTQEAGRVRVLSVRTARPLRAGYVFLAGLSEKAFPVPEPANRFYTEQETQELIRQKLPLVARRDQTCQEMLLFYEAITRASRHLVLSYAGLDESAQPLAPSPYLDELEALCGPGQIEKKELFELRPIPTEPVLLCPRDFRVRAMAEALEGKVELLAGLVQAEAAQRVLPPTKQTGSARRAGKKPSQTSASSLYDEAGDLLCEGYCAAEEAFSIGENILAAVRLIADRSTIDSFGVGEGMLQTARVLAALQERFSADYVYAATALEKYARCPFRFLLEEVLALRPPEELDLEEDYALRGRLTHQILSQVHRRLNERLGRPGSPTELEQTDWQTLLQQVMEETFAPRPLEPVQAALWEVHRRRISQWLADYRQHHQNYDQAKWWADFSQKPKPTFFEIPFGRPNSPRPEENAFAPSQQPTPYGPLELSPPQPAEKDLPKVRISGRIDRIDLGQLSGHLVFNVLDYKTGHDSWPRHPRSAKKRHDAIQRGTLLQLPLYLLAAQNVILADRQAKPWFAGYWQIKQPSQTTPLSGFTASGIEHGKLCPTEEWKEIYHTVILTVFHLVKAIRAGQFPVYNPDPDCTRNCPWNTACRIQQVRALEKTWAPWSDQSR